MNRRLAYIKRLATNHRFASSVTVVAVALILVMVLRHGPSSTSTISQGSPLNTPKSESSRPPTNTKKALAEGNPAAGLAPAPSATLITPERITFASNHTPPSTTSAEFSGFMTTPGALCKIEFTMGGNSIFLPAKTSDGSGNVSWYWSPAGAGLTAGSWKITATASLGGKTKTSTDVVLLQVP